VTNASVDANTLSGGKAIKASTQEKRIGQSMIARSILALSAMTATVMCRILQRRKAVRGEHTND
jgi:hypothetical protein